MHYARRGAVSRARRDNPVECALVSVFVAPCTLSDVGYYVPKEWVSYLIMPSRREDIF